MAQRPIFIADTTGRALVKEVMLPITWHSGFSRSQKMKNVEELHRVACHRFSDIKPLEVSTKSEIELGQKLSAFNLELTLPDGRIAAVENAYQGSKVFERGGPFTDIYNATPLEAKRDSRLRECGDLQGFDYFDEQWALEPKTAFYDWLYITALSQSEFAEQVMDYSGFTDIEFNPDPKKSFNSQARAVAMFVALMNRDGGVDLETSAFKRYYQPEPQTDKLEPQREMLL